MPDVLALLDAAIEDLERVPVVPVVEHVTGTVKSLKHRAIPGVPEVPAAKQETPLDTDISQTEEHKLHDPQEEAPLSLSLKSTGSTGTTGSGQDFRGFRVPVTPAGNGSSGNSPEEPARSEQPRVRYTPFDAGAAIAAGVPREWAEGLARLQTRPCPRGIAAERWQEVIDDARRFIERRAVEAAALGWDTINIFGAHPLKPAQRTDCMGLVWLLRGREVIAITADVARIGLPTGAVHTYSRREKPEAVPIWQLRPGESRPSAWRWQPVCCECRKPIFEPVGAWFGGEPVHRECGERQRGQGDGVLREEAAA